jgi:hypothetical protein
MMRVVKITICLLLILFTLSCNNTEQNRKPPSKPISHGEFRLKIDSGSWNITIPPGYTIEDSAMFMDRLAATPFQQPSPGEYSATLLYAYEPGSINDTIHYAISLSKYPWTDTASFERHLQTGVDYMKRTLNLDSAYQYLLSHRLVPDTISGQPFVIEEYDVLRGRDTVLFRYYNAIRGRQLLIANLHYYQKDSMGDKLKKAIESSVFQ